MAEHFSERFTLPGRILVLLSMVIGVGGTFAYIYWIIDDLPAGSYPVFMFAFPVVLGAAALFGLGVLVLRSLGISILRDEQIDAAEGGESRSESE
jgi:hypothetical protein